MSLLVEYYASGDVTVTSWNVSWHEACSSQPVTSVMLRACDVMHACFDDELHPVYWKWYRGTRLQTGM